MSGFDLILEKVPTKQQLKSVLSKTFEINDFFIFISEDIADFPKKEDNKLWCVMYKIEGQFLCLCKLFFDKNFLKNKPIVIAKKICNILNTHCLVDDNSIDPYSWIMLSPNGNERIVILDPDKLEEDIYIIN
jgi:hypothetical protein